MLSQQTSLTCTTIAALGLWGAAGGVAVVLTYRSIAGAFDEPVGFALPAVATTITLAGSLTAWMLFHRDHREPIGRRLFDALLAMVPGACTAFATTVNADPTALAIVTGLLLCGLTLIVTWEAITADLSAVRSASAGSTELTKPAGPPSTVDSTSNRGATTPVPETRFLRRMTDSGHEEIEVELTAHFNPGEQRTVVHVPIHPVLRGRPAVECEPLDDASLGVRVTGAYPYGVRVEVTRTANVGLAADASIGMLMTAVAADDESNAA